ncbi:MAG: cyclopropane-fatty-acyl-phospholipid synthase family protein [Candidatus Lokiarchaeia archaeon]
MVFWKYYDITHKEHIICNPLSIEKLNELIEILELKPGSKVLDIATGKAEFIIRLAEKYEITAVGIDLSPYHLEDAKKRVKERIPHAAIELIEIDGAKYKPESPESFDLVSCIGASWIYGGFEGTLRWIINQTKSYGIIVIGEPYWINKPPREYFEALPKEYASFQSDINTHYGNVKAGEDLGLILIYTIVSNKDDWDQYMGLQWYAANKYALSNPDDPDLPKILSQLDKEKELYLEWQRDLLGFAVYVFRK